MRVVEVQKWDSYGIPVSRRKKVSDGIAAFHQWGVAYEEFDDGPGNITTAIIERADGTIETPEASMVRFIGNTTSDSAYVLKDHTAEDFK